jgi:osmotically-inducible protein OsmY
MISRTVDGATVTPSFTSSPWMRRCPHSGFSLARRTTRRAMPGLVGGRPGLGRLLVSYLPAASRRCQASSVAVVLPDGHYRDDIQLITAANNALAQNVTVPDGVEAVALGGDITLTGTVTYISQRAAAEAAVAGLTGVRGVQNNIEISYAIDPVDVDVNVHQALERSALVPDGSDVTSDTKDGLITLTGHVRTWAEHDAVVGAAWMALGAVEIRDELQITG